MNIGLGFGSTEKDYESNIESTIREHVKKQFEKEKASFFLTSFADKIEARVEDLAKDSREKAESYRHDVTYPERYSSFYVTVLANSSYIVFIIDFSHVNRQHPMSPDGWAMMTNEITFNVKQE